MDYAVRTHTMSLQSIEGAHLRQELRLRMEPPPRTRARDAGREATNLVNPETGEFYHARRARGAGPRRSGLTTFIGFEYTSSTDDTGNLHRNVIFRGSEKIPAVPFSRFHSQNPEGLWDWMDGLRQQGIESLAIPHNSNGSNGQMFKLVDWAGDPMDDAYAEQRIRNEPLVEITQVKGTSETHPLLSTRDEWADFEIMPYRVATMLPSEPAGSYVRDALRRGLALESRGHRESLRVRLRGLERHPHRGHLRRRVELLLEGGSAGRHARAAGLGSALPVLAGGWRFASPRRR